MAARCGAILGCLALFHVRMHSAIKLGSSSSKCPFDGLCGTNCIGTTYGGRYLLNDALPFLESLDAHDAKVMAIGVGGDISFEVALACRYGFTIHLYDPSPSVPWHMEAIHQLVGANSTSAWQTELPPHSKCKNCGGYWTDVARSQVSADQLVYHQLAIADTNGDLTFYRDSKVRNETGSWTLDPVMRAAEVKTFQVPARKLDTLMRSINYSKLDILKLDVEGLEVSVLSQLLGLPDAVLPKLIYVDMDAMSTGSCSGESSDCAKKHAEAKGMIKRLQSRGYKFTQQHGPDVAFFKSK